LLACQGPQFRFLASPKKNPSTKLAEGFEVQEPDAVLEAIGWGPRPRFTRPSSAAALIYWVKVAESVVVTRGLSPLLPNDLGMATVI